MEAIAGLPSREINPSLIEATIAAFVPLLTAKKDSIFEIPKKTFKYGTTDRHQLDVYYPLTKISGREKNPILFFCYGGGFHQGDRNLSPLTYSCLGAFYARRGYIVVIPDYRLVPHVTYPGPVEDVRDAIRWVTKNANELVSEGSPSPDTNALIVTGHSAGAFHVSTMLFNTDILAETDELRSKIIAAVLVSPPYDIAPFGVGTLAGVINQYFGNLDAAIENDPLRLYGRLPNSKVKKLPKILMVEAENEPDALISGGKLFREAVQEKTGVEQKKVIGIGHNHVSLNLALSTGQGEEWAEQVVEWLKEISA